MSSAATIGMGFSGGAVVLGVIGLLSVVGITYNGNRLSSGFNYKFIDSPRLPKYDKDGIFDNDDMVCIIESMMGAYDDTGQDENDTDGYNPKRAEFKVDLETAIAELEQLKSRNGSNLVKVRAIDRVIEWYKRIKDNTFNVPDDYSIKRDTFLRRARAAVNHINSKNMPSSEFNF